MRPSALFESHSPDPLHHDMRCVFTPVNSSASETIDTDLPMADSCSQNITEAALCNPRSNPSLLHKRQLRYRRSADLWCYKPHYVSLPLCRCESKFTRQSYGRVPSPTQARTTLRYTQPDLCVWLCHALRIRIIELPICSSLRFLFRKQRNTT